MAMNSYDQGDIVRVSVTFKDVNGNLADPTTVVVTALKPDGTMLTPGPVRDGTGLWHADVDTTGGPGGVWSYWAAGTGALQADIDGSFWLKRRPF